MIGWRKAIVDAQSGLTRDRLYGVAEWRGREFTVVDTAGLDLDGAKDSSRSAIEAQTRIAIDQADVIVLLFDVRQGLTPIDRDIAQMLRKSRARVIVAANKADSHGEAHFAHELLELGFDEPSLVSAQHGLGVGELLDRLLEALPPDQEPSGEDDKADRLAIMGRPNVGKSSLLNALLGDERALVSPTPGTTRDPIDTELVFDGVPVVLIDTAGIRRKSSSRDRLERYSLLRGIHAMERSDVVLLVIEAPTGVLREAFLEHPPPSYKGRRLKVTYATQASGESPTVVLFVNDTGLLHFSYRRYLEKKVREHFGLAGNPLKLVLRPEESRRSMTRA